MIGPLGDSVAALLGNYNGLPSRQTTVEEGIRTSLDLPAPEEKLIEAAKQAGKPLVVVLMNGAAFRELGSRPCERNP